jgi:hypothetical protein
LVNFEEAVLRRFQKGAAKKIAVVQQQTTKEIQSSGFAPHQEQTPLLVKKRGTNAASYCSSENESERTYRTPPTHHLDDWRILI